MYYDEQLIDGVWHYKTRPGGNWIPMSLEFLSRRYSEAIKENGRLKGRSHERPIRPDDAADLGADESRALADRR